MKSNFTKQLFFTFYVFVFLLSDLPRCVCGLERAGQEERHRLMDMFQRTDDSSVPPSVPADLDIPPYLRLPVSWDSQTPLLDVENLRVSEDTEGLPPPERLQQLLRPHSTDPPPTELQPESHVRANCKHNLMFVEVDRVVLGDSDPLLTLRVGNCTAKKITEDYVYFELNVTDCGSDQKDNRGKMTYSNTLYYEPDESQSPIRRSAPFTVGLFCHFNRYQYSYKMLYQPQQKSFNYYKLMTRRDTFTLTPTDEWWQPVSPSNIFTLGMPMYFEAKSIKMLSSGQRLYIHSCFATPEPTGLSSEKYSVVSNYGCMEESKDGKSSFIPSANNAVRFFVDSFLFERFEGTTLYMHCSISVGPYEATDTDKSCNHQPTTNSWVELNGSDSVCSCCDSICGPPASPETVLLSRALNIEAKPTSATKKKRPNNRGIKRWFKSRPHTFKPKPIVEPGQKRVSEESEPVSEAVRWAVAEEEPLEVMGSAVVEEIKEPEEEEKGPEEEEKGPEEEKEPEKEPKRLIFEEIFDLDPYVRRPN